MLKEIKPPPNLIDECLSRKGVPWEGSIKNSKYAKEGYAVWLYALTEEMQIQEVWLIDELQLTIPSKCYHEFLNIDYAANLQTQYIVVLCFSVEYEYKCVVMGLDTSIENLKATPYDIYEESMSVAANQASEEFLKFASPISFSSEDQIGNGPHSDHLENEQSAGQY